MRTIKGLMVLLFLGGLCRGTVGENLPERFRLSVVVSERWSGRLLKKIPVTILPYKRDVKTDAKGRILLNLPSGEVTLRIDYSPYDATERLVDLQSDSIVTLVITAPYNTRVLEDVEVVSAKPVNERSTAVERLDKRWFDRHPGMMGEKDVLKTLSLTSGVTPSREGAADLQIRGGTQGQNLFLLDGLPLYTTTHFFGMASAYNPAAIRGADLYKAAFPARFGGKVASVLDVQTVDADLQHCRGEAEIGLLSAKGALHLPLVKNRLGLFLAGRLSTYSLINAVTLFTDNSYDINLNFNDLNVNLLWKPTDKDVLKLTGFSNADRFNIDQPDGQQLIIGRIENSQRNACLSWQRQYDVNRRQTLNLYADQYTFRYGGGMDNLTRTDYTGFNTTTTIRSLSANTTYEAHIHPVVQLTAGGAYSHYWLRPVNTLYSNELSIPTKQGLVAFTDMALFGEARWQLTKQHQLDAGLRLNNVVNDNEHFLALEPRISYHGHLSDHYALSASLSKMTQSLHKVQNPGLGMPLELFVPSGGWMKPQQAWIFSVGAGRQQSWSFAAVSLKTDLWFKQLDNLVEFKDGYDAQRILVYQSDFSQRSSSFLCQGSGYAFGIDVSGHITFNKLSYTLDYTWMKATNRFDDLNQGHPFPASTDIRHALSMTLDYACSPSIRLSANWQYRSGSPVTVPTSYALVPAYDFATGTPSPNGSTFVWMTTQRNNERTLPFHKLDLTLTRNVLVFRRFQGAVSFGVYNVYNRSNPYLYFLDTQKDSDGSPKPVLKSLSAFPVMPSISFRMVF